MLTMKQRLGAHPVFRKAMARFRNSTSATAAVEFALISPVLVLLLGGSVELSGAVTAGNRATYVAETIGQVVSQSKGTISAADMTAFIKTASLVDPDIVTYANLTGKSIDAAANVSVSSVVFTANPPTCVSNCAYTANVVFSVALNGPKRPCGTLSSGSAGSMTTLPAGAFSPSSLVVVDVETFYRPLMTTIFGSDISFKRSTFFRPRYLDRVDYVSNCPGYPAP